MTALPRSGFAPRRPATDLALGIFDGVDQSLWCFVYASVLFSGALSPHFAAGAMVFLAGWIVVALIVALTSPEPLHIANLDDQAVVILSASSVVVADRLGADAAGAAGLSTVLAVLALTTTGFAAGAYLVGRYRLTRMVELIPFPVICGFMASAGWLMFAAGIEVATGAEIGPGLSAALAEGDHTALLIASLLAGLLLTWLAGQSETLWAIPLALLTITGLSYGFAAMAGLSKEDQVARGWLFELSDTEGGGLAAFAGTTISAVDWNVVLLLSPTMLTVAVLAVIHASITAGTLKIESDHDLDVGREFRRLGIANAIAALFLAPPSYTDAASSTMYRRLGATSRWVAIVSSAVGVMALVMGSALVAYLPKVLVGAGIFLFAFSMLRDWLFDNLRGFTFTDRAIVLTIVAVTIAADFLTAFGVGIVLTALIFVVRYGMIRAIGSRSTLVEVASSVERSRDARQTLDTHGAECAIYSLRGFLFFGSANAVHERVMADVTGKGSRTRFVLLDFRQVTGIDVSAGKTLAQLHRACAENGIALLFSGLPASETQLREEIAGDGDAEPAEIFFANRDYALETIEERVLERHTNGADQSDIRLIIENGLGDRGAAAQLQGHLTRLEVPPGDYLFRQGDRNDGFYIIESGSLAAYVATPRSQIRVKKFAEGALVGELSGYLRDDVRSASVKAETPCVVHHLSRSTWRQLEAEAPALAIRVHRFLAATLAVRVSHMNKRIIMHEG